VLDKHLDRAQVVYIYIHHSVMHLFLTPYHTYAVLHLSLPPSLPLLLWQNSGTSFFTPTGIPSGGQYQGVSVTSDGIYVALDVGPLGVYLSTDSGSNFNNANPPQANSTFRSVLLTSLASQILAGTGFNGLYSLS